MWLKNKERLELINPIHVKALAACKTIGQEEYLIHFDMQDGDSIEWRYENETERDIDFERIERLLESGV